MKSIYLAGGLFNAAERLHNLYLERYLKPLGYNIILPQRRALNFFVPEKNGFDVKAIAKDCAECCRKKDVIVVCCLDGPDADSGTSIEFAIALETNGVVIGYRTDFRTAQEQEVGINGMFNLPGAIIIYEFCFYTGLEQVVNFYEKLAQRIHEEIRKLN
jgi:nucleoside 2-deoxyribosyltransferase